jgi:hypothetical protein
VAFEELCGDGFGIAGGILQLFEECSALRESLYCGGVAGLQFLCIKVSVVETGSEEERVELFTHPSAGLTGYGELLSAELGVPWEHDGGG